MRRTAVLVFLVLLAPACGAVASPTTEAVTVTTVASRMGPTPAADLDIALDPDGRPYDVPAGWFDAAVGTRTRDLGELVVLDGELRVLDGIIIEVDPAFFADEATSVDLGGVERVELSIIAQPWEHEGRSGESVLGVRLDLPGRTVERWGSFEYAYGTDGGLGAVTSGRVLERGQAGGDGDDWYTDPGYVLLDLDGEHGDDTFVFGNGSGDGGFPMSRGFDAEGRLASVLVWDTRYPWRLAIPEGTPPPDVSIHEEQLLECIEGQRPINEHGVCATEEPT